MGGQEFQRGDVVIVDENHVMLVEEEGLTPNQRSGLWFVHNFTKAEKIVAAFDRGARASESTVVTEDEQSAT